MNIFPSQLAQVPQAPLTTEEPLVPEIDQAVATSMDVVAPITEAPTEALTWQSFIDKLMGSFMDMFDSIITGIPNVVIGGIIFIVGLLVATILKKVIGTVLKGIKLDEMLNKMGMGEVFSKIGLKDGVSKPIAGLFFWIIMLFIVKTAASQMGIDDISLIVDKIIAFLPKVLVASIIMLAGFMVADMVRNVVYKVLDNLGLEYAKALAGIIFGFIFIIVLTVALSQLEIQTELLNSSVKIILASLGLGLAICLGLGLKRMAGQIVSGVYARDIYQVGTVIEYEGEEVKVAGVGPVTTKLMTQEGGFIMVPNDDLVSKPTKGRSAE